MNNTPVPQAAQDTHDFSGESEQNWNSKPKPKPIERNSLDSRLSEVIVFEERVPVGANITKHAVQHK